MKLTGQARALAPKSLGGLGSALRSATAGRVISGGPRERRNGSSRPTPNPPRPAYVQRLGARSARGQARAPARRPALADAIARDPEWPLRPRRKMRSRAADSNAHEVSPLAVTLVIVVAVAAPVTAACTPVPEPPSCSLLPDNNVWHADISKLPVNARSAAWMASSRRDRRRPAHPSRLRRAVRHPLHHRLRDPPEGGGQLRLRRRERPGPVPAGQRHAYRSRQRRPRPGGRPLHLQALRDLRHRQYWPWLDRRQRRGLRPALGCAAPRRLDLRGCCRAADPAGPAALRRGGVGQGRPRRSASPSRVPTPRTCGRRATTRARPTSTCRRWGPASG